MKVWKTLREEKPDWREGAIFILTRNNKIVPAWYNDGKFWRRVGLVRPITYKRWCYEKDLAQQALNEINSQ